MEGLNSIKNSLIDRILATKNEKLLRAISNVFDSTQKDEVMSLSSEQIEMLLLSEKNIENEALISESDLNKADAEWLN